MIIELCNFNPYFQIQLRVIFPPRMWSVQEVASGVRRMTVFLLPRWVSWTAPTRKSEPGKRKGT